MPGLVRGVARTAVVAGTATAVSNRVSRRQANRWAGQEPQQASGYYDQAPPPPPPPQAPPPPAAPSTDDKLAQLKALGELKASGVLTEAEFEAQKAKILAG
jgi:putative oligomerization/nucleic acid binding protein